MRKFANCFIAILIHKDINTYPPKHLYQPNPIPALNYINTKYLNVGIFQMP